jgi:hypothetical protein
MILEVQDGVQWQYFGRSSVALRLLDFGIVWKRRRRGVGGGYFLVQAMAIFFFNATAFWEVILTAA